MPRTFLRSRIFRILTSVGGVILFVISFPGLFEDIQTWAEWIKGFDFRMSVILAIVGLLILGVSVYSEIHSRRGRSLQKSKQTLEVPEKRDIVPLKEAIDYIANSTKWGYDKSDDEILERICQKVIDSRITVTGFSHNSRYQEPISQERCQVPTEFLCQSVLAVDQKEKRPVLCWHLAKWGKVHRTGKSSGADTFFISEQRYYDPEVDLKSVKICFDDR
jgi:hypothetical protein